MSARPRIDLDGVTLVDPASPYMPVALFRYRTVEGLVLLLPESAEVLVPWSAVESAALDLLRGELVVRFSAELVARERWLRGAATLVGDWLDRQTLTRADVTR